ncbi:MAG: hypothetical protein KBT22_09015 [Bacteroidales bacterium]|nr:hypothetical protein [Candidatus Scybalocola fimicaballi]
MKKDLSKILITLLLPSCFVIDTFGQTSSLSAGSATGKSSALEMTYTIGEAIVGYSDDNTNAKYAVSNGYEVGVTTTRHIIHYYVADKEYAADTFYTGDIIIPVKDPYIGHDSAFIAWDEILPERMPSTDLILNAVVDERSYDLQLADNYCPGDTINIKLSSNWAPNDIESFTLETSEDSFPKIFNKKFKHEDGVAIASFVLPANYSKGGQSLSAKMTVYYFDGYRKELKEVNVNVGYSKDFLFAKVGNVITISDIGEPMYTYQWQKDGENLPGETNKFFQDEKGLNGAYSVVVGTDEGLKTICPQSLYFAAADKKGFATESVFVRHGEDFTLTLDGFNADEIEKGEIIVFDYKGSLALAPITDVQRTITLNISNVGVYVVAFTQGKHKRYTTKVIVK